MALPNSVVMHIPADDVLLIFGESHFYAPLVVFEDYSAASMPGGKVTLSFQLSIPYFSIQLLRV